MFEDKKYSIGKDLALRRVINNLRQREVAQQAGICRTVLSYYETGKRIPKPEVVAQIHKAIEELAKEVI